MGTEYWQDLEADYSCETLPTYDRSPELAARKLKAIWTMQAEEDLRQWHGIESKEFVSMYQQMIQEGDL